MEREASIFGRYLLDEDPSPELTARYVSGSERLFPGEPSDSDAAVLDFVKRHPGSLPFLDAASALTRRGSLLRRKILLMAAILEASPVFAGEFLAPPPGRVKTFLLLGWHGTAALVKAVIGWLMLPAITRRTQ